MTEVNQKRKQKKPPKGPEAKKHLTDVRVLQRNLAYIIGLPLNLAKEEVSNYYLTLCVVFVRHLTGIYCTHNLMCLFPYKLCTSIM